MPMIKKELMAIKQEMAEEGNRATLEGLKGDPGDQ